MSVKPPSTAGCGDNRRQQELHQQRDGSALSVDSWIAMHGADLADKLSERSTFQDNLSAAGSCLILSGLIGADGESRMGCGELVLGDGRPSRLGEDAIQGGKHN